MVIRDILGGNKWFLWDGEGNGNPLQYCLENPLDGGAWWAAIHRAAQSRTRLKQLCMHACMGQEGPQAEVMATPFSIHARKKSHEQKTLMGYGQWGREVSDIIKQEHQAPVYL